jgi:ABC-type branched-subunit amino acid transport system substrate-binding protein
VNFVTRNLDADNVVVIDSQDDYSVPLATSILSRLRSRNVDTARESVSADDTDFSSVVANVGTTWTS